jgi:5-methylcytosine-specific restriction endonuclease McrA
MQSSAPLMDESEIARGTSADGEAVLFNAGVRALTSSGFSNLEFDIGGKKSRRRYVNAKSPNASACTIWIKSTTRWIGMADVSRFPWSKRAVRADDSQAVMFAVDDAARRGATHLLAIVGNDFAGKLSVAHLYTLDQFKQLVTRQSFACRHPFYVAHGAAVIIHSYDDAFAEAETIALAFGTDLLTPQTSVPMVTNARRARSGVVYKRDATVRNAVLKLADGICERCGQQGFLTVTGERYLETHHVVGVSERGPDTTDNVIAVCPNCHRQAHFAANRVQVERDLMEAIRRRRSKRPNAGISIRLLPESD